MRTLAGLSGALLVCAATLSAQTPVASGAPLSLDDALSMARASNKTIAAARLQHAVSLAGVDVARERPNPELTYEGTRETPRDAVVLSVPIELGGKRGARVASAQAAVSTDDARLDQVIASVLDDVRHEYVLLTVAERRVAITQEVADLFTRARDAAHARFQLGDAPRRDDVAAQADYLTAQADVMAAQGEVRAVRSSLNILLGQPADAPLSLTSVGDLPVPTLEAALARVGEANTELRIFDRRIAEQNARINVARLLQTPDISAGGGVSFDAQPEFAVGWRVNFGVTLPLFTTHRAGVVVENAELSRLKADREATLFGIQGAVAAAIARASSAADRVKSYETDILPLTRQDEAFAQDSYQSGQTGLDALILALQHARERRLGALQARQDFETALADLERAISGPIR